MFFMMSPFGLSRLEPLMFSMRDLITILNMPN